ncbi:MAG: alpha/beta fold hydrolase [Spirochaetia bacterium]|nr:alpha/beta fold hydrolase [Spirochaetia bacterium]
MRIPLHRYFILITIIGLSSCANIPEPRQDLRDGLASAPTTGALTAGMLLRASESKKIPSRKPRALLTLASPRILGSAIDMRVLDSLGYPQWREEKKSELLDVQPVAISFLASQPEGGMDRQSGMLYLPLDSSANGDRTGPRVITWIVFLKGTEHLKNNVPSRGGGSERALMETAAALGYAVWAPDYAGMGDSPGPQAYCVPESMAASALNGLEAARDYVRGLPLAYTESGRLSIMGYSQGGLAAMATLTSIADGLIPVPGLGVSAAYVLGAPLDLMIGVPFLENKNSVIRRPDYNLLLVMGWARSYPDIIKLEDILLPKVIRSVLPLYDGKRDGKELCRLIARAVDAKQDQVLDSDLYLPQYLWDIRHDPDSIPYYHAQSKARLDRWTPPSNLPIRLAASPVDETVPFLNSERAFMYMKENNPASDVVLVRLASASHGLAAVEGLLYALLDLDRQEPRKAART